MDENKPQELEETFNHITYLVGAMQSTAEKDDGSSKREYVYNELLLRSVYPIHPVKQESNKTGMNTNTLKDKMKGWKLSGNWELYREKSKEIWIGKYAILENGQLVKILGDIDYVNMSTWITFIYNKGDKPCGSFGECYGAVEHQIPIYIITDITKSELPDSLVQWVECTEGKVFENFSQYFDYIDKEYKLKRIENKKI